MALPVGALLQIGLLLLKAANYFMQLKMQREAFSAGEDRQISRTLVEMTSRLKTFKEVEEEYARMTDKEIVEDIGKKGDFRD
jgi:hypothetical protein